MYVHRLLAKEEEEEEEVRAEGLSLGLGITWVYCAMGKVMRWSHDGIVEFCRRCFYWVVGWWFLVGEMGMGLG